MCRSVGIEIQRRRYFLSSRRTTTALPQRADTPRGSVATIRSPAARVSIGDNCIDDEKPKESFFRGREAGTRGCRRGQKYYWRSSRERAARHRGTSYPRRRYEIERLRRRKKARFPFAVPDVVSRLRGRSTLLFFFLFFFSTRPDARGTRTSLLFPRLKIICQAPPPVLWLHRNVIEKKAGGSEVLY